MDSVTKYDPWFAQKRVRLKRLELSTMQKCTTAIFILAYANAYNEYYKLDESTAFECMKRFIIVNCACFESTYLRQYTCEDFEH